MKTLKNHIAVTHKSNNWLKINIFCAVLSRSVMLTLCDPIDCSPLGSSVTGILQQEYWSGLPCPPSRGSFQSRDQTQVSRSAGEFFNNWEATRVAQELVKNKHYFSSLNCVPSKKICPKVQFL